MDSAREDHLQSLETTTVSAGDSSGRPGRRKVVTYALTALIPLAAVAAAVTLLVMAGNAAAATGGCGGG